MLHNGLKHNGLKHNEFEYYTGFKKNESYLNNKNES